MTERPESLTIDGAEYRDRAQILWVEPLPPAEHPLWKVIDELEIEVVRVPSDHAGLDRSEAHRFAAIFFFLTRSTQEVANATAASNPLAVAESFINGARSDWLPPILFVADADIDAAIVEQAYTLGAFDCLIHPFAPAIAKAKLRSIIARHHALHRAHREAQQMRWLVEGTRDYALFLLDRDGQIVTWNAGAESLKGYAAAEIIGQHFSIFYPREANDRGWPAEELRIAAAEGRLEDEGWRLRKDGTQFWANVVITALRDDRGQLHGFSKVTRDLTERKAAEENAQRLVAATTAQRVAEENAALIREQQEWLRVTLASIGDAVIATDAQGRVTFLNPVAEELTGWPQSEAEGMPLESVFAIVNEQTRLPIENPVARVLRVGTVVGLGNHTVLLRRDGDERPIDDSAAPIRDASGQMIGVVLIFRDVTEQRHVEQQLRESESRKSAVIETALDCVITMDHQGRVVEFNPAAEKTFGFRRNDVIGKVLADVIIPPEYRDRHRAGLSRYLETGESTMLGQRVELLALRVDGTQFPVEVSVVRISTHGPPLFTAYIREITTFKRAEQFRNARLAITHGLADATALNDGIRSVLRAVCENLGWDIGLFWLTDASAMQLNLYESWRQPDWPVTEFETASRRRTFKKGEGIPGRVWENSQAVWIREIAIDPNFPRAEHAIKNDLHSALACPVVLQDQTLGVIEFFTRQLRDADSELLELMSGVAGSLSQFIERRRVESGLRDQTATAETLYRISNLLAQELALDRLVQVVTDEGTRISGAQFGAFFYNVVGERGESYTLYTLSGVPREAFSKFPMPRNTQLFGPTFRGEGIVRIDDVTQDPRFGKNAPYFGMPKGHLPVRSYLALPVIARSGEVLGGLFFGHEDVGVFTGRHERLLLSIASQAAVAIENARLHQKTHATAERLNLALSAADLGDWSWDTSTDTVTLSARAAAIFGLDVGTSITWSAMQALLHPLDRERARREVERVVAERVQYDIEYRVNRPAGDTIWIGVLGRAIYDQNNQPIGMYGVVQDISERKRLEESYRSSEERLRLALSAGSMGVWDWNIRTGELQWSDSLEPLHGLAPGTFDGTFEHFQRLVHPDDLPLVNDAIRRAVEQGDGYDIEFRVVWPSGQIRWIAGKGTTFPAEDGRPGRMIGIGIDITHRKHSEQIARFLADASAALSLLEDFDNTLAKVAQLAVPHFADWAIVFVLDANGELRRVALAHADPEKIPIGAEFYRRFPPDSKADYGVWHILRTGQAEIVPEVTDQQLVESIDGEDMVSLVRSFGIKSYMGVPLRVRGKTVGVFSFVSAESGHTYDDTDLAAAQDLANRMAVALENAQLYKELREADRRKDEFLATLAHELRNPLAPIRNGLQVLRLAGGSPATEDTRAMMDRQLQQLVRLVDDLLDVSRITRNKLALRRERVTLSTVINSAVETSRPLLDEAGHTFILSLPKNPVYLDADLTRLAQVFSNLLNNSAKYTDRGGRISLTAVEEGSEIAVRVVDSGVGIPADALPNLFQMFSQVDRHLERAQGGLGIGLTLVRRLVEMHGGTVQAHSAGLGHGSEFVVRLPVVVNDPFNMNDSVDEKMKESPNRTSPRRILVVDDNRDSATSLGIMLKLMGHKTQTAFDGLQAIAAAEAFRPDMILLDIGLPKLNGYEACQKIREQAWSEGMVIVALTGWGQEEDRRKSQAAGFDLHLVKPVEMSALQQLLS